MTRHLLYLFGRSLRNRLHRQARRLRSPRYALALIVALAYFYFAFGGSSDDYEIQPVMSAAGAIGPLFLALLASWWWLWGGHRAALSLTPAETHMLLPAPMTRRQLIQLKVMQAQAGVAFSAVIGTVVTRGTALPWPLRLLSLWVLLGTLHLHQAAASLVHASAEEQGRRGVRAHAVPLLLFAASFAVLAVSLVRAIFDMRSAGSIGAAAERLSGLLQETGPALVLTPFQLLLAPTTAQSAAQWLPAFAGALLLLVLHYVWIQRTDAAFEETAAEAGARIADRTRMLRSGASWLQVVRQRGGGVAHPWLPLPPVGPPAYALFWKNIVFVQRLLRPATLILLLVALLLVVGLVVATAADTDVGLRNLGIFAFVSGGVMAVLGPIATRNDLRLDLRHIELLRTYPLRGRDVAVAEMGASTLTLTLPQLILVLAGFVLIAVSGTIAAWQSALGMLAALLVLPVLNALGISIQNTIALLYPGWTKSGVGDAGSGGGAGGIEDMGQNILTVVASVVLLSVSLVPAALVGVAVGAALSIQLGLLAGVAGAAAALMALAGEVALFTIWIGRLYDTTDPVTAGLLVG